LGLENLENEDVSALLAGFTFWISYQTRLSGKDQTGFSISDFIAAVTGAVT
jgi:hypothetical protein